MGVMDRRTLGEIQMWVGGTLIGVSFGLLSLDWVGDVSGWVMLSLAAVLFVSGCWRFVTARPGTTESQSRGDGDGPQVNHSKVDNSFNTTSEVHHHYHPPLKRAVLDILAGGGDLDPQTYQVTFPKTLVRNTGDRFLSALFRLKCSADETSSSPWITATRFGAMFGDLGPGAAYLEPGSERPGDLVFQLDSPYEGDCLVRLEDGSGSVMDLISTRISTHKPESGPTDSESK